MDKQVYKFVTAIIAILGLTAVIIIALIQGRINNPNFPQVSVIGRGKISAVPDTATVNLGVNTFKAATAKDALSLTTGKINAIITAIKGSNLVDPKDIQTTAYSLNPQYDFIDQQQKITGYNANQQVTVKIKNIDVNANSIDAIIDLASKNGSDQIGQITFSSSKLEEYKQQARLLAIADAKKKAVETAGTVGVRLGDIIGWWENYIEQPYPSPYFDGKGGFGGSSEAAVMPATQPGLLEVVIEMNLNYKIKN